MTSFTSERHEEDALSTVVCFHCTPVFRDPLLETVQKRQERAGSRRGEEKGNSDLLAGIKSPLIDAPTQGLHQGSGQNSCFLMQRAPHLCTQRNQHIPLEDGMFSIKLVELK